MRVDFATVRAEKRGLEATVMSLRAQVNTLVKENAALSTSNTELKVENAKLVGDVNVKTVKLRCFKVIMVIQAGRPSKSSARSQSRVPSHGMEGGGMTQAAAAELAGFAGDAQPPVTL